MAPSKGNERWAAALAVRLAIAVMTTTAARAQDLRNSRSKTLRPLTRCDASEVSVVDKARRWAAEKQITDRLSPREGLYARFGGMVTGSGLALGAGYRKSSSTTVFADVSAALSTKFYKAVDARARWARFWRSDGAMVRYRYRDYPQEDFFGPVKARAESNRMSFGLESTDIVAASLVDRAVAERRHQSRVLHPTIGPGTDDNYRRLRSLHGHSGTGARCAETAELHQQYVVYTDVDYRDRPGQPDARRPVSRRVRHLERCHARRLRFPPLDADAAQFSRLSPGHVWRCTWASAT